MTTVTASELQKNFGRYQAHAQREAVKVTSHGRESVVLLSAEHYERLRKLDDRVAMHPADLPYDLKQALDASLEDMGHIQAAELPEFKP